MSSLTSSNLVRESKQQPLKPKVLVIHQNVLTENELDELHLNMLCLDFNPKYNCSQAIDILFQKFDCIIIDISDKDSSLYFSQSQKYLDENNIEVVYKAPKHQKVDIPQIKKDTLADFVIKYLPKNYKDEFEFVKKLLSDHVSVKMKQTIISKLLSFLDCTN